MAIINTGRGDEGKTDLFTGERIDKDSIRVETYGTLDELNSFLGVAKHQVRYEKNFEMIEYVQEKLFTVCAVFASSHEGKYRMTEEDVGFLNEKIDEYEKAITLPHGFVKPGGNPGAGALDVCRTVARRAERRATALKKHEEIQKETMVFLNRLSDMLYLMARAEEQFGN